MKETEILSRRPKRFKNRLRVIRKKTRRRRQKKRERE
jgi:hypothetical protein